jgi:hypothetical protein
MTTWRINLSPSTLLPGDTSTQLEASVAGDVITINGDEIDLTDLPENDELLASAVDHPWIVGRLRRLNGEIQITIIFPIPVDASAEARAPAPVLMLTDGPVPLPSVEAEQP